MVVRAEAVGQGGEQGGEQAAVGPLVRAETAGDRGQAQGDGLRGGTGRDDLGGGLQRAADGAGGDPQAAGLAWQQGGQIGAQAGREGLAVELAGAGGQPGQVGVKVRRAPVGDAQRGEHAARGPGPQAGRDAGGTGPGETGAGCSLSVASRASISGVALARHSRYSSAGPEAATIPPPLPSQTRPAANSKVRIATFSSRPATGLR